MTYILLFIYLTNTPRPSMVAAEYSTKARCEAAANDLRVKIENAMGRYPTHVAFVCSEK